MWNPDRSSLPAWIQDAYDDLAPHFDAAAELSPDKARELLVAESDAVDDPAEADVVLDRLLERGWLYEVDGMLRKTD